MAFPRRERSPKRRTGRLLMSETKRYMPFWMKFLLFLTPVLLVLTLMAFILTGELLIFILTAPICFALTLGMIWVTHKKYESRIGTRGVMGYLLLLVAMFMFEWIWVELCLVLLGSGVMLYDIVSKRDLSDADSEARKTVSEA